MCIEKLDCFVLKCVLHREKQQQQQKKILWFFVICTRCTVCYAGLLLLILSSSDKGGLRITEEFLKVKWKYIVHAFQWATHLDCPDFFLCTKACRQIWVWPGCAFINEGTMEAFQIWASADVDIMYSSNFVTSSRKKKMLPVEWTNSICAKWRWICILNQPA